MIVEAEAGERKEERGERREKRSKGREKHRERQNEREDEVRPSILGQKYVVGQHRAMVGWTAETGRRLDGRWDPALRRGGLAITVEIQH
jgi:hypothetical protein